MPFATTCSQVFTHCSVSGFGIEEKTIGDILRVLEIDIRFLCAMSTANVGGEVWVSVRDEKEDGGKRRETRCYMPSYGWH